MRGGGIVRVKFGDGVFFLEAEMKSAWFGGCFCVGGGESFTVAFVVSANGNEDIGFSSLCYFTVVTSI